MIYNHVSSGRIAGWKSSNPSIGVVIQSFEYQCTNIHTNTNTHTHTTACLCDINVKKRSGGSKQTTQIYIFWRVPAGEVEIIKNVMWLIFTDWVNMEALIITGKTFSKMEKTALSVMANWFKTIHVKTNRVKKNIATKEHDMNKSSY